MYSEKRILVAGGTGFVGSWIVAAIEHINLHKKANIELVSLSRSPAGGLRDLYPKTKFYQADIGSDSFAFDTKVDCVFNAATPSSPSHGGGDANQIMQASINGTKNILRMCSKGSETTFINLSSGIVTKRSAEIEVALDSAKNSYLVGKRKSEELVSNAILKEHVSGVNLRLYAFAGPGIALSDHFAVGNFLNDAINGNPIVIKGNPETSRSYLYPTDLVINLFNSAVDPHQAETELGSAIPITMQKLAETINTTLGNSGITQNSFSDVADNYFPTKGKIFQNVSLTEAIARWAKWINFGD
jgi:nucleoside-diphosphate-sugar epimerase